MKYPYLLLIISSIINAQCLDGEFEVLFETNTEEWAEEMTWELLDSQGDILYTFQGQQNYSEFNNSLCLNEGCYALNAIDSYGDGWNDSSLNISSQYDVDFGDGQESLFISPEDGYGYYTLFQINSSDCSYEYVGCTDSNAVNYDSSSLIGDESCVYQSCEDNESLVSIESITGDYGVEMSWELVTYQNFLNSSNDMPIANFQGTGSYQSTETQVCLDEGCYMFIGYDNYGDGWEDGVINMTIEDGNTQTYEIEDGGIGYFSFVINVKPCEWDFPGCTDENAYNYNSFATIDDGSCINPTLFDWDNIQREYLLYLPNGLPENAPLVFVFHGYSGNAEGIMNYSEMNAIADLNKFAVCYPQGTQDQYNTNFWNVGYDFQNNPQVDDIGYVINLAEYLQNTHNLSSVNTFSTGMSNGADFSYMLACQASGVFKAIAPVAGMILDDIYNSCNPSESVPVFEIHGTNDNVTYFEGDPYNNDGWGAYLDIPATMDFWVSQNNLSDLTIDTLPNINQNDGSYVISYIYSSEFTNNEVWLYKVVNGGHDWPGSDGNMDIDSSTEIWKFFSLMTQDEQTGINSLNINDKKRELVKTVDILGRENNRANIQIEIYNNGTTEKKHINKYY